MNERILLVEDEPAIRELIAVNLRHSGYQVNHAITTNDARASIAAQRPDLIVLDWMLPGQSGVDFARDLRTDPATADLPIILLTARASEGDKLLGFEVGADDYLTKPFSPRELVARVKALLRRRSEPAPAADEVLQAGELRLEPASHRVFGAGQAIELSPTEFRLLTAFMRNPERVLTRARLLDMVWNENIDVEERTVDVHIRRLRLALRPSGCDRMIETVRGGGYRFVAG
ncbi:MAG: phosphate regulon transcriptional regulator PhoB [Burkholderiaceae bacterium]